MDWWLTATAVDLEHLVPIAAAAEAAGFGGVALGDHLVFPATIASAYPYSRDGSVHWDPATPWPDPWVAIAAMASATRRLRFTTAVYVAPLRDPVGLAKLTGTASVLSQGRLSCGFGSGWLREEFDVVGCGFDDRGARLDEVLEVLTLLWSGRMVEFHGAHHEFGPVQMSPPAPGGRVPILLGGNTDRALDRAARHDGWIGVHRDRDTTARLVASLRERRRATGLDGPFEIATVVLRGAPEAAPLAEVGVDSAIIPLLGLGVGPDLQSRVDAVTRFGDEVIGPGALSPGPA